MTIRTRTRLRLLGLALVLALVSAIGIVTAADPPVNEGDVQPKSRRFTSQPGLYIPHALDDVNTGAAGSPVLFSGTGAPTAAVEEGSIYMRSDGAVDTTLYLRASGAWSAIEGVGGGLQLLDSECLDVGTGDDATFCHDGTTGVDFSVFDNDAGAFRVLQGANLYIVVQTTNGAELVQIGQTLDLNAILDQDVTLTAAGDGQNVRVLAQSATGNTEGVEVAVVQDTNARTAGTVRGVLIGATSLAGDLNSVEYRNVELMVTDGGGAVVHEGIHIAAGFDAILDVADMGTGQADIVVADNLASALEVREAANSYMLYVTTDGAERVRVDRGLDLNALLDHDLTLTAAGDGYNLALLAQGATGDVEGLDVSVSQDTAARTADTVRGVRVATTSLAGDLNSVEYRNLDLAVTDGGGAVVHEAIHVGVGFDAAIDAADAATGQADVVIGDNLASAWQFREAATAYLTLTTTNAGEEIQCDVAVDATAGIDVTGAVLTTAVGITNSAGEVLISGGNAQLNDDLPLQFGTSVDFSMDYDSAGNRLDFLGANPAADTASAAIRFDSGDAMSDAAIVASGAITIESGASDTFDALATAGASGAIAIGSGNAADAGAGTGGASGALTLRSGTAVDGASGSVTVSTGAVSAGVGNSGDIILTTGTSAGGARGVVDVNAAVVSLATQAIDYDFIDNSATAVSWSEGANVYFRLDSTNAAERIDVLQAIDYDAALLDFATQATDLECLDNNAAALLISEGANAYLRIDTTDTAERVDILQIIDYDAASIDWATQATANTLLDNSATAMTWASGGATWLTLDTTNGAEGLESTALLTTTDGVASGTVRSVGGRAYSNVAASTAITGASEDPTNFDANYSLPADSLRAGSVISVHAQGIHTATTGAETHGLRLLIGGYVVQGIAGIDPANDDVFVFDFDCVVRTIGAGGTAVCDGATSIGAPGAATRIARITASAALNTTIANVIAVEIDRQPAATDTDSARLDILVVEIR